MDHPHAFQCSSASRKFLNTTILSATCKLMTFQCSSASRKFLNCRSHHQPEQHAGQFQCSSASRKFLNNVRLDAHFPALVFQCSSASRKFLNSGGCKMRVRQIGTRFSALQRAENFSIIASISVHIAGSVVSVLFSEPKISQSDIRTILNGMVKGFSALQRAENFSIVGVGEA